MNYKNVKDFKYNINNTIAEITMEQLMDQAIDQMDKLNFQVVQSKYSGILTYHFDGYEELKAKNVNPDTFNKENYKQEQLRTNDIIAIDSPVCKIVTSEDWQVVTMLSEEQYKKLEEKSKKSSKLKVTILKNDFTTYVPFELTKKDDVYYATLSFDKYMINYLDDRFLDIELHINQAKECFERAIEMDPNYALAHYNLARTLSIKGEKIEAAKYYQMALDINAITDEIDPEEIQDRLNNLFD